MGSFRFFLALLVCYAHLQHDLWLMGVKYLCPIPVEIFYIISGFIIPLAFNKYYYNKKNLIVSYIKFILSRFIKIFPLYWLAIFIVFLDQNYIHYLNNKNNELQTYNIIIKNIILIFNDHSKSFLPVIWSLDHEIRFYLTKPLLIYIFLKRKNLVLISGIIIILISDTFTAHPDSIKNSIKFFSFGFILFLYKDNFSKLIKIIKINTIFFAILFHFFIIMISLIYSLEIYFSSTSSAIILITLILNKSYEKSSKIDNMLGNISYPIYLLHPLILGYTFNGFKKIYYYFFESDFILLYNIYQAFCAFITITIISFLFYKFFLKPIEDFKKILKK
jgi:exopolysaccharide production protein ExoZ